ncbi:hypothetical protein FSP39_001183 [Pinctada imbricata]|uniref:Uncharacterized protein n=1 Tax=Pinctada imbricata TaxID=66713 RepID=A0AA89BN72_PINIB|nr:hypothetical protein FSP39_001183 [Pinctada imbricata]
MDFEQNFLNLKYLLEDTVSKCLRELLLFAFDKNVESLFEAITNRLNENSHDLSKSDKTEIKKGHSKKSVTVLKIEVLCKIFRLGVVQDRTLTLLGADDNGKKDHIKNIENIWTDDIIGNKDEEELSDEIYNQRCVELLEISNYLIGDGNQCLRDIGNKLKKAVDKIYEKDSQGIAALGIHGKPFTAGVE